MPLTDAAAPNMFTIVVTARASNPVYGLMIPSRTPGAIPKTRYRIPKMSANKARKRIAFRFASRKLSMFSVDRTENSRNTKRRVTGSKQPLAGGHSSCSLFSCASMASRGADEHMNDEGDQKPRRECSYNIGWPSLKGNQPQHDRGFDIHRHSRKQFPVDGVRLPFE